MDDVYKTNRLNIYEMTNHRALALSLTYPNLNVYMMFKIYMQAFLTK